MMGGSWFVQLLDGGVVTNVTGKQPWVTQLVEGAISQKQDS